jgi:hypothetical protein
MHGHRPATMTSVPAAMTDRHSLLVLLAATRHSGCDGRDCGATADGMPRRHTRLPESLRRLRPRPARPSRC